LVSGVVDRTAPGPAGPVPVRVYVPTPEPDQALPVLIWYHGGGWVMGNLDSADLSCRAMTNRSGCVVISVDYRLAPEAKFPAAVEDAYAVLEWVAQNATSLGIDARRIAVGGDSAGGNLAAVVAQLAKAGSGPQVAYQALVYPVTNHHFDTPSYDTNGTGYLLTRAAMEWFWAHYLRSPLDGHNPVASPLRAPDLTGLPPAIVITAEYDPLRDEGEAYAARLRDAGVSVSLHRYDGQIHGFYGNPAINDGLHAVARVSDALRGALFA
jgi:acetyl esterase